MFEYKDLLSPAATIITGSIAVIIAVKGWLVNAKNNREHHIFQIRLGKRMEMFDNVVPVLVLLSGDGEWSKNITSETLAMLQKARVAIQLYGYKDEIEIYEEFVAALENKDLEAVNRNIPRLSFFVQKLREELGYPAKPVTESKC